MISLSVFTKEHLLLTISMHFMVEFCLDQKRPVEIFEVIALLATAMRNISIHKTISHLSNYPNTYVKFEKLVFSHLGIFPTFFFVCRNFYLYYKEISLNLSTLLNLLMLLIEESL
jgi:hypothetical protein